MGYTDAMYVSNQEAFDARRDMLITNGQGGKFALFAQGKFIATYATRDYATEAGLYLYSATQTPFLVAPVEPRRAGELPAFECVWR